MVVSARRGPPLRRRLAAWAGRHPALYFPLVRWFGSEREVWGLFDARTEFVLEGFPRSANSWAVNAFCEAQPVEPPMAAHRHVEAQVLAGVSRGLPVLVLVRRPADAIRSWLFVEPQIPADWALRRWIAFYAAVEQVADKVVIATFEQVTDDFSAVIARVNARFGSDFVSPEGGNVSPDDVLAAVTRNMIDPAFDGRPDQERTRRQNALPLSFGERLLRTADALYDRLAERAD